MELLVIACFGLIAWMNAAVGHGGASGYTALMVLAGFAQVIIRPVALELNLLVSALATWHFFRAGYFRKRLFLSLILLSVPMAYLGSLTVLPDRIYKVLLGCCLLISVVRIAIPMGHSEHNATRLLPTWLACIIGGFIGLVSGMVGIGGGILLSPVLLLGRWLTIKETAALSAPFIFVNSLAGLSGLFLSDKLSVFPEPFWLIAAMTGGLLGAWSGSRKLPVPALRWVLVVVLSVAAGKLFLP